MVQPASARSLSLCLVLLHALTGLAVAGGAVFLLVLGYSVLQQDQLIAELARQSEVPDAASALMALRAAMLLSLVATSAALVVLTRLLAVVRSVRDGDPFGLGNAQRLRVVAWGFLTFQLFSMASIHVRGIWISPDEGVDWIASIPGWTAVLLLFVIAQAFDHGARLREDLEGTI